MTEVGNRIVPPAEGDLRAVLADVRPADALELTCVTLEPLEDVLRGCIDRAERAYCLYYEDAPLALFGVRRDEEGPGRCGVPWMVGTRAIDRVPLVFARLSRRGLTLLESGFDELANLVDVRNRTAVLWLRWIGFEFEGIERGYGASGEPFWRFRRETPAGRAELPGMPPAGPFFA